MNIVYKTILMTIFSGGLCSIATMHAMEKEEEWTMIQKGEEEGRTVRFDNRTSDVLYVTYYSPLGEEKTVPLISGINNVPVPPIVSSMKVYFQRYSWDPTGHYSIAIDPSLINDPANLPIITLTAVGTLGTLISSYNSESIVQKKAKYQKNEPMVSSFEPLGTQTNTNEDLFKSTIFELDKSFESRPEENWMTMSRIVPSNPEEIQKLERKRKAALKTLVEGLLRKTFTVSSTKGSKTIPVVTLAKVVTDLQKTKELLKQAVALTNQADNSWIIAQQIKAIIEQITFKPDTPENNFSSEVKSQIIELIDRTLYS